MVELDEVVVLAQLLLDREVLRTGGPVLHLPQVPLFELLESDEVELAFLVGELSEAHRTQQRTLLALGTETDDLDLLVFVLGVHAVELRFDVELGSCLFGCDVRHSIREEIL